MPQDTIDRPTSRYGRSPSPQKKGPRSITGKWIVVGIIIVLILAVVYVAWTVRQRSVTSEVSASMAGFSAIDDSTLQMDVDVTRKDVTVPSYCIVTALDINHAEIGRREVLIPAGGNETQRITTTIPSTSRPVSGGVYGCSTSIPAHLSIPD
ncbi:DUF4307 domain-containing protein [Corynebacterium uropygiale]|uniref:DUF4307 domain-containing protein n=1 Tax=Corynebacterium uropygiale TaxID=1775911 RepID=A0A9X1QP92_9CORY|nr:DUF4307 domain-containing protein [Corynebacterium uropygiale]MCF4006834.1 DUF4307 domain-containing protein [Corynebacterium uropygiale]